MFYWFLMYIRKFVLIVTRNFCSLLSSTVVVQVCDVFITFFFHVSPSIPNCLGIYAIWSASGWGGQAKARLGVLARSKNIVIINIIRVLYCSRCDIQQSLIGNEVITYRGIFLSLSCLRVLLGFCFPFNFLKGRLFSTSEKQCKSWGKPLSWLVFN